MQKQIKDYQTYQFFHYVLYDGKPKQLNSAYDSHSLL